MQYPPSQRGSAVPVEPSYRQLRRAKAAEEQRWQVEPVRSGLLGFWLNLAAPPPVSAMATFAQRERQRKAELSAYVAFGVFLIGLALIPNAFQSANDLYAIPAIMGAGIVAAVLNRNGYTRTAAVILISVFFVAIGGAMAASAKLDLMWIPALDFFAVPVFLSGLLLSRRAPFGAVVVGAALVATLLLVKPRDPWLTQMVGQLGIYHFMVRPIGLMLIVAIASWLWGRSVEHAIMRADRAEEVAAMEHQLADQKRQLDRGIQNLLETHVRVSNGDFSARAATNQDNVLWQIAVSLNTLLSRLGKFGHIEQRLGRTEAEIDRLAVAVETAIGGRQPSWPAPSGTRVDRLLSLLTGQSQAQPRQAPVHTPPAQPARAAYSNPMNSMNPMHAADSNHTGAITGKWREITDRHDLHMAGSSERPTEHLRRAPWAHPQPNFGSPAPAPAAEPINPTASTWRQSTQQPWGEQPAPSAGQSASWEMAPLPPLAPLPDAAFADLAMPGSQPGRVSGPPRPGTGNFAESFPGQLREGASWEDLRDLRGRADPQSDPRDSAPSAGSSAASAAPSNPAAQTDGNYWPDWPSFLRNLDAQTGD